MTDIEDTGLTPALSNDSASLPSRIRADDDAGDEGDSGDVIGEMRDSPPSDLGDVANKGSKSTIFMSKSGRCTDDRCDSCDPGD